MRNLRIILYQNWHQLTLLINLILFISGLRIAGIAFNHFHIGAPLKVLFTVLVSIAFMVRVLQQNWLFTFSALRYKLLCDGDTVTFVGSTQIGKSPFTVGEGMVVKSCKKREDMSGIKDINSPCLGGLPVILKCETGLFWTFSENISKIHNQAQA